jgi:AcrR family transcriptional regulator
VGRRTIFRYFPSKNDIVFGALDERLHVLAAELEAGRTAGVPLVEMVRRAFHATSRYERWERESLATRIYLIGSVPSLQAHAALRYQAWENVVRAAVQRHTGIRDGVYPRACAAAVVGVMRAAFDAWLEAGAGDNLPETIDSSLDVIATGLSAGR